MFTKEYFFRFIAIALAILLANHNEPQKTDLAINFRVSLSPEYRSPSTTMLGRLNEPTRPFSVVYRQIRPLKRGRTHTSAEPTRRRRRVSALSPSTGPPAAI